jgi:lipid-A-disaccharide synthase
MPGSRRGELRFCLGVHLDAAREIHARDPKVHFILPVAPSLERSWVEALVSAAAPRFELPLTVLGGGSLDALLACDVAVVKPGTSTLEAALLGRPVVVAARVSRVTAAIVRRLLHVDTLAMPNLILGSKIVPEFLQEDAKPKEIAKAVFDLLEGPARDRQLDELGAVRDALGNGGAAQRAAEIAEEMIIARRES